MTLGRFLLLVLAMLICSFLLRAIGYGAEVKVNITKDNVVVLRGEVDNSSASQAIKELLMNPNKELYLYQDSPGGSITAGLDLINAMKSSGKTIKCVQAFSASMSFVIMQNCHERLIQDNSILMQHQALVGLPQQSIRNQISIFNMIQKIVSKQEIEQAKRIGISLDSFQKKIAHDWWLYGDEAIEANVADAKAVVTCNKEVMDTVDEQVARTIFGSFKVKWSKCPLVTMPISIEAEGMTSQEATTKYFNHLKNMRTPEYIKSLSTISD